MATDLNGDIARLCQRADTILWSAFAHATGNPPNARPAGRLVVPRYRANKLRVSEQEARFAFVEALGKSPLRYSVETPTRKLYGFSGGEERSAQTDLTIRDEDAGVLCNVEFKSRGFSPDADPKDLARIDKDIEKLVRERVPGLWFHLLKSVDNQTINRLFDVLGDEDRYRYPDIESPGLAVHLCVLKQGFSIHKRFPVPPRGRNDFSIDLHMSRTELRETRECNGWRVTLRERAHRAPEE